MTLYPKYRISYNDEFGAKWEVLINDTQTYSGDVIELLGGVQPCIIEITGDEDNILDTIRNSQATLNIEVDANANTLIDELSTIQDMRYWVTIKNLYQAFYFSGWLVPDQSFSTFSKEGYTMQLLVTSPLSAIKSIVLQNADGTGIYGKQSLYTILKACNTLANAELDKNLNIVNNLTLDNTSAGFDATIFGQISVYAEMFNGSNGVKKYGYDIIESIVRSFVSFCYWYRGKLNIINPAHLDTSIYKTLVFKDRDTTTNFLINNDEQLTFTRGSKTVSIQESYTGASGFLKDSYFSDWTGSTLNQWTFSEGGTLTKVGAGTQYNPYGAFVQNNGSNQFSRLSQAAIKSFSKGDKLTLKFSARYYDWKSDTSFDNHNYLIIIPVCLVLNASNGDKYYSYSLEYPSDYEGPKLFNEQDPIWIKDTGDPTEMGYSRALHPNDHIVDSSESIYGLFGGLNVGAESMTSTSGNKQVEITMPELPADGTITAYAQAALKYHADADGLVVFWAWYGDQTGGRMTYFDMILSYETAQSQKGQIFLLTTYENYSQVDDAITCDIGTAIPDNISGATYVNIPYISADGTSYNAGDKTPLKINYNTGTTKDTSEGLSIRDIMYYKRFNRRKIDISIRSNEIFFDDLLRIPQVFDNSFLQIKNSYDTKKAEQKITAIELKGEYRNVTGDSAPDIDTDYIEAYNTT